MADTTFRTVLPPLKAVDNGDGTYSVAIALVQQVGIGNTTFTKVLPPLKAVTLGDGTYAVSATVL